MAIATFSPPFKAVSEASGFPVIVIAVEVTDSAKAHMTLFHTVDMDGRFKTAAPGELTVDWRYDPATEKWGSASEPDAEIDV